MNKQLQFRAEMRAALPAEWKRWFVTPQAAEEKFARMTALEFDPKQDYPDEDEQDSVLNKGGQSACWFMYIVVKNPSFPLFLLEMPELVEIIVSAYMIMGANSIFAWQRAHSSTPMADAALVATLFLGGIYLQYGGHSVVDDVCNNLVQDRAMMQALDKVERRLASEVHPAFDGPVDRHSMPPEKIAEVFAIPWLMPLLLRPYPANEQCALDATQAPEEVQS